MERIPILKMGEYLLVSIQVDMHDRLAMTLQADLTDRIVSVHAKGVLIDISALEVVDSFIGRMINNIAAMAHILDARIVVVGMQPAVAITLVELGMVLAGVRTALTMERGMKILREMAASSAEDAPRGVSFLFNRNRLNVAVSRAKYTAIIVRSTLLTDYLPSTPDRLIELGAFSSLTACDTPSQ